MNYKIIKNFLEHNKKMTITDLSKKLNISRQTIYDWNEKGVIPKKYEEIISKNILSNQIDNNILGTILKIDFEVSYGNLGRGFFVIDKDSKIIINDQELIVDIIDEYKKRIKFRIDKDNFIISSVDKDVDFEMFYDLSLNIIRYETDIDTKNKRIKYILYCSVINKDMKFMSSINKNMYIMLKNKLYFTLDGDITFKNIINYVKLNEIDSVFVVNNDEMKMLYRKLSYNRDYFNSKTEAMGLYVKYNDSIYEFLKKILGDKFDNFIEYYRGCYEYLNIIFICMDNIKSNLRFLRKDYSEIFREISLTVKENGLYLDNMDLLKIVFAHECGHLIFSYSSSYNEEFEERRANYFVSFIFSGKYDYFTLFFVKLQPIIYHNPLVIPEIESKYNLIFNNTVDSVKSLKDMYDEYYKNVDKLYE